MANISEADASEDRGWIVVEFEVEDEDIEARIALAISDGVRVDLISEATAKG